MTLGISGEDVDALRLHVKPLLDWACIGGKHDERNAHYRAVTEGHDPGAGAVGDVSSCGFLPSWVWYCVGCRQRWINRDANVGYRPGLNIANLCWDKSESARREVTPASRFELGDALIVWAQPDTLDAHVMVVREHNPELGLLEVSEYGQPGGHTVTKRIVEIGGRLMVEGRVSRKPIHRWLPFAAVVQDAAERGLLEPPSFPWRHDTEPAPSLPPESNR